MNELTIAAAVFAGLVSFISPCCLPVVPAYLGQLGALVVTMPASAQGGVTPGPGGAAALAPSTGLGLRRLSVLPHALAFVVGFGGVFTLLGVTATYALGPLSRDLPFLRQVGGVILVVLGLNLAGILRVPSLARSWRPLDRFAAARRDRFSSRSPLGAFGLGAIFALGWTPCIGPTLGAILGLATLGDTGRSAVLFVAYSAGLGIPFVALALAMDRAPGLIRPLLRHGPKVEFVGGMLVMLIGFAILFDFLTLFARAFSFLWPRV